MHLTVTHKTTYQYDAPVSFALQQLRLMPKNSNGQNVLSWNTRIEGGTKQLFYVDQHRNHVELIAADAGTEEVTIYCEGEVECTLSDGVVGKHVGLAPIWFYRRSTPLTKPGPSLRQLAREQNKCADGDIGCLHQLMNVIADQVDYEIGKTHASTSAEEALAAGHGVCQDHAHIMIALARLLGYSARYVSGYLFMEDQIEQSASHAWAEIHVDGLGWVGFDPSNRICPDERYVRVATGLDYNDAAPMSGMRFGNSGETMIVSLQVQQ